MIRFIARLWLLIVSLLVFALVLAACGGEPPVTSWPGYTVRENTAYLASANQLVAVELGGDTAGVQLVEIIPACSLNVTHKEDAGYTEHDLPLFQELGFV